MTSKQRQEKMFWFVRRHARNFGLSVALGTIALVFCSCATQDMIAKANGVPGPLDSPNQPPTNPNPAYYALVPVVLPFDLVAWPFQYFYLQNRVQYTPGPTPPPPYYQEQPYRPQSPPPGS